MRFGTAGVVLLLGLPSIQAGEFRAGVGIFTAAPRGADFLLSYRMGASPWTFGIRHVQWMDTFHDPFTGRALSETDESRTGPLVTYAFSPGERGSWYLGGALYHWSKREKSLIFGDSNRASTTTPLIGGGYTRAIGTRFYWNGGIYLGPAKTLKTQTSTGSEEDSGVFDIQIQIGVRF